MSRLPPCRAFVPIVLASLLAASCAGSLASGEPAPPLTVDLWLHGEGAQAFEPGRIYVIDHWATWCQPCIESMPRTAAMRQALAARGVEVLMVSQEHAGTVSEFVGQPWVRRLGLSFGVDADGTMARDWFSRAPVSVPRVFVVDGQGRFVFTGHPTEVRAVVEWLLERPWDEAAFAAASAEYRRLWDERKAARDAGRLAEALAAAEAMRGLGIHTASVEVEWVRLMLLDRATVAEGYATARALGERLRDDAAALNSLAWAIATDEGVVERDLPLALALVQRSCELSEHADANALDTLARVHFELGELERAVEWQREAVAHAAKREREAFTERLERYEDALGAAPPPQEADPFADRDGDPFADESEK